MSLCCLCAWLGQVGGGTFDIDNYNSMADVFKTTTADLGLMKDSLSTGNYRINYYNNKLGYNILTFRMAPPFFHSFLQKLKKRDLFLFFSSLVC